MEKISAVIITRNEERVIGRALDSLSWADEIVVVDQFSSDGTAGICRGRGCRVFERELDGFGAQKQFGVRQASNDWVFSMDADEVVTPELRDSMLAAVAAGPREAGFMVYRANYYLGRRIRHCGWYVPILRLFRRSRGAFDGRLVHESVVVDGPIGTLDGDLLHYTYTGIADQLRKMDLYSSKDAEELRRRGVRVGALNAAWYLLLKPSAVLFRKYVLLGGFIEGLHGLVLSCFAAFGVCLNYAKLWELQRRDE